MEAWLPKYIFEPRGMSARISRSEDAERILQKGIAEGEILSYRLHLLTEHGEVVPKKRVLVYDGSSLSYLKREKCEHALVLQREI